MADQEHHHGMFHTEEDAQHQKDQEFLAKFGYKQELDRSLGFLSTFAIAFGFVSATNGFFALFYYGLDTGGPAGVFWSWPIVVFGQLMVALVFAEAASHFPLAGGVYAVGQAPGHEHLGLVHRLDVPLRPAGDGRRRRLRRRADRLRALRLGADALDALRHRHLLHDRTDGAEHLGRQDHGVREQHRHDHRTHRHERARRGPHRRRAGHEQAAPDAGRALRHGRHRRGRIRRPVPRRHAHRGLGPLRLRHRRESRRGDGQPVEGSPARHHRRRRRDRRSSAPCGSSARCSPSRT